MKDDRIELPGGWSYRFVGEHVQWADLVQPNGAVVATFPAEPVRTFAAALRATPAVDGVPVKLDDLMRRLVASSMDECCISDDATEAEKEAVVNARQDAERDLRNYFRARIAAKEAQHAAPEAQRAAVVTEAYQKGAFRAEIPEGSGFGLNVEVWESIGLGHEAVICVASDKFAAMKIVEALAAAPVEAQRPAVSGGVLDVCTIERRWLEHARRRLQEAFDFHDTDTRPGLWKSQTSIGLDKIDAALAAAPEPPASPAEAPRMGSGVDAVEILRSMQWCVWNSWQNLPSCPICHGVKLYGHGKNCRLAAALATRPATPPQEAEPATASVDLGDIERLVDAYGLAQVNAYSPKLADDQRSYLDERDAAKADLLAAIRTLADEARRKALEEAACVCEAWNDAVQSSSFAHEAARVIAKTIRALNGQPAALPSLIDKMIEAIVRDVIRPGVPEVRECCDLATELRAYAGKLESMLGQPPTKPPSQSVEGEAKDRALADVAAERRRQIDAEGWTFEHDNQEEREGQLAGAAACYAFGERLWVGEENGRGFLRNVATIWPWSDDWWKPSTRRRDLVKAGALILAEIERLDRDPRYPPSGPLKPLLAGGRDA